MLASHMSAIAMQACKTNDLVLPLCDQLQTVAFRGLRQALVPTGFAGIGHLQQIAKDLRVGRQLGDGGSVLRADAADLDVILSHGYLLGLKGLHKQKSPLGERAWGGGSRLLSVCHAIRSDGLQLCSMQGITHNGSRWVVV